jgi:hypothetical protein
VPSARDHVGDLRFEFEGDDTHPLVPVRGTARIREGVLEIDHGKGGFLVSQGKLALAKDDVAAIEIRSPLCESDHHGRSLLASMVQRFEFSRGDSRLG